MVAVPPSSSVACSLSLAFFLGDIGYPFLSLNTSFKLTLRPIGSSPGAHTEGGGVQSPAGSALGAESAEMTGSGCSQEETRPDVFQAGSCKIALELLSCL